MFPQPTFPWNGHAGLRHLRFCTRLALVDEGTATSEIELKLYHPHGIGAGRQHLIAEAPFDPHAGPRDGVRVDFFGHSAGTFRSLALIAQAAGATLVSASSWREASGSHVLRFEEALSPSHCDDVGEEIRRHARLQRRAGSRDLGASWRRPGAAAFLMG